MGQPVALADYELVKAVARVAVLVRDRGSGRPVVTRATSVLFGGESDLRSRPQDCFRALLDDVSEAV